MKPRLAIDVEPTVERFRALSPAGKLAVAGIGVLLLWLAMETWSWGWARSWGEQADRMERVLADAREIADRGDAATMGAAEIFGPLDPPGGESEGAEAMAQAVVEVVKRNRVSEFSYDAQRASSSLGGNAVVGGQRLSRISGELQFESSPEAASAIIAGLESSPHIESVRSIRIQRKEGDRKVGVRLTVEAWVVGARRSRGLS